VQKWEPIEISSVSVPADATVGIGRAAEQDFELALNMRRYACNARLFDYAKRHGGLQHLAKVWQDAGLGSFSDFLRSVDAQARHEAELAPYVR
jgi:hypothetical protein